MSSDEQSSNQRTQASSLDVDISTLASLINPTATKANNGQTGDHEIADEEQIDELGTEELEELMDRINAANDLANGVEDKLDGILEHLDGLLGSLEAKGEAKEKSSSKDTQPDR